jgi:hypothetical protein
MGEKKIEVKELERRDYKWEKIKWIGMKEMSKEQEKKG